MHVSTPPQGNFATKPSRLQGIDSARGLAMLLVFLSHFSFEFFRDPDPPASARLIWVVTLIASPTFMLVSGMMLGLLYVTRGEAFGFVRRRLERRGLFLLTAGHVIIVIACIPRSPSLMDALTRGFITDVIGVGLLVVPVMMGRVSVTQRLLLAVLLLAAGLGLQWIWHPDGGVEHAIRYILVGPWVPSDLYNFALLPWLALYLLGTCIGEWASREATRHGVRALERRLALLGLATFAAGGALKATFVAARASGQVEVGVTALYRATSPLQKMPPSLPYMLVFGGVGLLLAASMLALSRQRWFDFATERLALLGRASLFVFLLQFYVYYVGFHYLELPYEQLWPLYFAASVVPIYLAAAWWLERGYNRLFAFRLVQNAPRREPRPDAPGTSLADTERQR